MSYLSYLNSFLINSDSESQSTPIFLFKRQRLIRKDLGKICNNFAISIYLVSLQFLSVETCGRGAYLPFQGIVVGLDDWLSGFCHGYTEQSGFFGADLCGSSLFLSAIRVDGLQKVSSLKSNRSLENDSKTISMTDLIW